MPGRTWCRALLIAKAPRCRAGIRARAPSRSRTDSARQLLAFRMASPYAPTVFSSTESYCHRVPITFRILSRSQGLTPEQAQRGCAPPKSDANAPCVWRCLSGNAESHFTQISAFRASDLQANSSRRTTITSGIAVVGCRRSAVRIESRALTNSPASACRHFPNHSRRGRCSGTNTLLLAIGRVQPRRPLCRFMAVFRFASSNCLNLSIFSCEGQPCAAVSCSNTVAHAES